MLGSTTYGNNNVTTATSGPAGGGGGNLNALVAGLIARKLKQQDEDRAEAKRQAALARSTAKKPVVGFGKNEAYKREGPRVSGGGGGGGGRAARPQMQAVYRKMMGGANTVPGYVETGAGSPNAAFAGWRERDDAPGRTTFANQPSNAIGGALTSLSGPPPDRSAPQRPPDATDAWYELPSWYRTQILARQAAGGEG